MDFGPVMDLAESNPDTLKTYFNSMPCFVNSGGTITDISPDLLEVTVSVPLSDATRNAVGTIYGGSMYAASDAIYMMLLWFQLGPNFLLFDRSSKVEYRRPATAAVTARCALSPEIVAGVRDELVERPACTRDFIIEFRDPADKVVCSIEKQVYIRRMAKAA